MNKRSPRESVQMETSSLRAVALAALALLVANRRSQLGFRSRACRQLLGLRASPLKLSQLETDK